MNLQATSYRLQVHPTMRRARRGYTLVEAVIYIAILAGLLTLFISLLISLTRSYSNFRLARDIVSSSSAALDRLTSEIRRATGVNVSSTLSTNPGRLVLNTTDDAGAATTMDFYLSSGVLMVKEGSSAAASTTSARTTVSNLIFRQITTTNSTAVKIELTLTASRGVVSRTEKFYTTAVLRGSY